MKEKLVILRSSTMKADDRRSGGVGGAPTGAGDDLSIEVGDIDRRELPKLESEPDVVAVAPGIPMHLIEPLEDPTGPPPPAAVTWGVTAVGADTSPFTGDGIVVAVLDTGIDANHPAFAGVNLVQKDFTGEGDGDKHGHGTHCAGTIFGRDTEGKRIGVARGVKKALIGKVIGSQGASSEDLVRAIQWAMENGANVISMSLGIDFPGLVKRLEKAGFPTELATSRALEGYRANVMLFERLASLIRTQASFAEPTIIVAAAGNESRRELDPKFEIAVAPPAVAEGIVSVAAVGQGQKGLTIAPFSNTGANVSGPGVSILSAKAGGGLRALNGTSMATPHVAGVAALWAEKVKAGGNFTAFQLTGRLVGSAESDAFQAGFDPFAIGAGLVHAPQR